MCQNKLILQYKNHREYDKINMFIAITQVIHSANILRFNRTFWSHTITMCWDDDVGV